MMKRWTLIFALLGVVGLAPAEAFAGAWTQAEGQCYAKLWGTALFGSNAFGVGEEPRFGTEPYTDVSLNHYAECGLTDQWTLLSTGKPVGWSRHADQSTLVVGRLALGVRRAILEGPLRLALEVEYGYQGLAGDVELARMQPYSYRPAQRSHTGRAGVALGYGTASWWVTGEVGARVFSASELLPALVASVQAGWKPTKALVLDLHVPINFTLGTITTNNIIGAGNTNYVGLGLGASYWFTDTFALSVGFDGAAYAEANAVTPSLQLGVEFRPSLF